MIGYSIINQGEHFLPLAWIDNNSKEKGGIAAEKVMFKKELGTSISSRCMSKRLLLQNLWILRFGPTNLQQKFVLYVIIHRMSCKSITHELLIK